MHDKNHVVTHQYIHEKIRNGQAEETYAYHAIREKSEWSKKAVKIEGKHIWIKVIEPVNFVHVCFQSVPVNLLT